MGQKANTLTLRKNINKVPSYASNTKAFLNANDYINTLKRSLEKKNVIIVSHSFNATTDTFDLSLSLFFKTRKVQNYLKKKFKVNIKYRTHRYRTWMSWERNNRRRWLIRRRRWDPTRQFKKRKKHKTYRANIRKMKRRLRRRKQIKKWKIRARKKQRNFSQKKASKNTGWIKTLSTLTKNLPSNNLVINKITLLNKQINMKIVKIAHIKFKYFKKILFSRRFDLYYDFLKLTSLLITKKVKINVYNVILGKIFRYLTKRSHNKFFKFLKKIAHLVTRSNTIGGIKFGINGKLKGKLRAKSFKLEVGKIGIQTIISDIDYSQVHINTLYGCFGLKTWIKYN